MEVEFHNLGCFPHFHLELPKSGLLSFTAKSGTGKSTWFDCLIWILTGKPKSGIICRDAKPTEEAWGKITLNDLMVHRKRGKDKLEVVTAEGALEGAAAQAYLNNRFGNFELVCASAYSKQEEYHPLLRAKPVDRLELMQTLVTTSQKPSECIEKVTARLNQVTTALKNVENKLHRLDKELTGLKEEDFEDLAEEADTIEDDLKAARVWLAEQEKNLALFHRLSGEAKSIRKLMTGLKSEVEFSTENLREAREKIKLLETEQKRAVAYLAELKTKERAATLLIEIAKLPKLNVEPESFDLKALRTQESKFETASKLMKACGLEYSEAVRKSGLEEFTNAAE
jgi:DNA repair exonuclease SbcCD ATPase subunit